LGNEGWNTYEENFSVAVVDPSLLGSNCDEDTTLCGSPKGDTPPRAYSWNQENAPNVIQSLESHIKYETHKAVDNVQIVPAQQILNEPWTWETPPIVPPALSNPDTPPHFNKGDEFSWVESESGPQHELSHEPQQSSISLERHMDVKSSATSIKSTDRRRSSTSTQKRRQPQRSSTSTKLRTAKSSQTFMSTKNTMSKSPPTDDTYRTVHNNVEKQYRMRMNAHFETLLATIPKDVIRNSGIGEGGAVTNVSKAETLLLAVGYIKTLERQEKELSSQNKFLEADVARFKKEFVSKGEVLLP
jgi:hypothetical protein